MGMPMSPRLRLSRSPAGAMFAATAVSLTFLLLAGAPTLAVASNCAPAPAIPDFGDPPCMTLVDRSADATVHVSYSYDPVALGMIPPDMGQSLYLVAFSERPATLPFWLTWDQVKAAQATYSGDCTVLDPDPELVLETSTELAGKWTMLTPTPLEISAAQADMGFDWDTTGLEPGMYHLYGYADAGRFNVWNLYPGAFMVVDDPTPNTDGPIGLFLRDLPFDQMFPGQEYNLQACAFTPAGSELDLEWALSTFGEELTWNPMQGCFPTDGGDFQIPFLLPFETADDSVQFRGVLRDPMGREVRHFTSFKLMGPDCVTPIAVPPACESFVEGDASAFPRDMCGGGSGTDGGTTGGTAGGSGTDTSSGQDTDGGKGGGCACRAGSGGAPGGAALGLLLLAWGRRRRSR